jgi:hypothetical protein
METAVENCWSDAPISFVHPATFTFPEATPAESNRRRTDIRPIKKAREVDKHNDGNQSDVQFGQEFDLLGPIKLELHPQLIDSDAFIVPYFVLFSVMVSLDFRGS